MNRAPCPICGCHDHGMHWHWCEEGRVPEPWLPSDGRIRALEIMEHEGQR